MISGSENDSLIVSEPGSYSVVVFSEDGCPSEASIPQAIGTTGFDLNTKIPGLQFYPNPVSDAFTLEFGDSKGKKTVTIYQFNGAQIETHDIYGSKAVFPLPDYAAGVYFVKVVTENSEKTIRFVKK